MHTECPEIKKLKKKMRSVYVIYSSFFFFYNFRIAHRTAMKIGNSVFYSPILYRRRNNNNLSGRGEN